MCWTPHRLFQTLQGSGCRVFFFSIGLSGMVPGGMQSYCIAPNFQGVKIFVTFCDHKNSRKAMGTMSFSKLNQGFFMKLLTLENLEQCGIRAIVPYSWLFSRALYFTNLL